MWSVYRKWYLPKRKKSKESDGRSDCIHPALLYFMYIMGRIFLLLFLRLPLMKYGKAIGFFKLTPSVQFIPSVMSDSLRPHGLQHARPPCPSPTPGVYLNLRPLSWWYHPTISFSVVPSPPTFNLSTIRVFSNESALHIRWPKYWSFSFSISPSNEYSGLNSFRMSRLDLLVVQGTLKSLLQHCTSKASILWCSAFFMVQLSHWW